ncbi:hypothetical protein RAMDARK_0988 [Rickettsia amblyommatis str. Darkwater]|nr:hypothetical protein RAMDARK_0988 [Rickettsia amblyommatis str. Darkwater]
MDTKSSLRATERSVAIQKNNKNATHFTRLLRQLLCNFLAMT